MPLLYWLISHLSLPFPVKAALICVDNVYESLAKLLDKFNAPVVVTREVSNKADIDSSVVLGNNVGIGTFSVLEKCNYRR